MKRIWLVLGVLLLTVSVSGCSGNSSDSPRPNIVVSTNAYLQLVKDLQGKPAGQIDPTFDISVISSNSNVDPHEFEPSSKDRLLVANADLVLYVGTEADQFMEPLLDSVGFPSEKTIKAKDHQVVLCPPGTYCALFSAELDANPHLWYDLASDVKLAPEITNQLKKLQPQYSDIYDNALKDFQSQAANIKKLQKNFQMALDTSRVHFFTAPETLANRFITDLGFAPTTFGHKLENGVELSAKEMASYKRQMKNMKIELFVLNEQVDSPQAVELADYARSIGVPVIKFSEGKMCNLPAGQYTFLDCFRSKMFEIQNDLKIKVKDLYPFA